MEENLDSINDIVNKKYDSEEKLSRIENSEKNSEDTNKLNVEEKDLDYYLKENYLYYELFFLVFEFLIF